MPQRSLHIAWLGASPRAKETGGVPGVATELLFGLCELGHRVDCFFIGQETGLPQRLRRERLEVFWSGGRLTPRRSFSRIPGGALVSALLARGLAALRLRRVLARRHREDPYDIVYQFNSIETLSLPAGVRRAVALVIHPEAHMRGELRFLIRERALALQSGPAHMLAIAVLLTWVRSLVQRVLIGRAQLVVCISAVFRDHLVRDYGVPRERTVVVPNPVRLSRFTGIDLERGLSQPPALLVLGRVAVRKGVQEVIELARLLEQRGVAARIRMIGRASLWSDYIPLLEQLPPNAEFAGELPPDQVPGELARTDVLLQLSWYEPFGLTVAEALAAGVPVLGTSEVGALEGVAEIVGAAPPPGDLEGIYSALTAMLERLAANPGNVRASARAEAERLFAPEHVCERISRELQALLDTTSGRH